MQAERATDEWVPLMLCNTGKQCHYGFHWKECWKVSAEFCLSDFRVASSWEYGDKPAAVV